jgi:Family of unknown function (DUF6318)
MRDKVGPSAAVAALLLAGACSGSDPGPAPLPSASFTGATSPVAPSATASSTPTAAPTLPDLARQDSSAGAEAFATFWLTALDYAYRTGNTAPLRSAGKCRGCLALADSIDRVFKRGGRIEGGSVEPLYTKALRYAKSRAALVRVDYRQAAGRTVSENGKATSQRPIVRARLLFTLERRSASWNTTAIQPLRVS